EDLLAEEAVTLGLERAVVDGLRLLDLAVAPGADVVRTGQADLQLVEEVHVEHGGCNPSVVLEIKTVSEPDAARAGPGRVRGSHFFDAAGLTAREVDAELLGRPEDVLLGVAHLDRRAVLAQHLDVEAQRLHLLDEDLERLRDARDGDVLALDDRLVDLDASGDVVGLARQQLLQGVYRAVRLHRPDLHLTEALAAELRLTAERLLGDHGVRTGRARVDLVVDQVVELEDVHVADRDRVRERLAAAAVEEPRLAVLADQADTVAVGPRGAEQAGDLVLARAVEHRGRDLGVRLGGVGVDPDQ